MDISTVAAHSLEWYEDAGKLSGLVIDEEKIEPENRIPRITSATWYVEIRLNPLTSQLLSQEIRERSRWHLHPLCRPQGSRLQLRT